MSENIFMEKKSGDNQIGNGEIFIPRHFPQNLRDFEQKQRHKKNKNGKAQSNRENLSRLIQKLAPRIDQKYYSYPRISQNEKNKNPEKRTERNRAKALDENT